ncbi:phage head spike fiber domain-containing protein [Cereibacter changlensis]|uniref:phage head spike fiber domain-containing protein n=1 Tax=Cereibacter changlensis TaxID=402884 RepID=UPI0040347EF9
MTKLDLTRAIAIKGPGGVIDRMKGPGFNWNKDTVMTALFANNTPGVYFDPSDKVPVDWRRNLLNYSEDGTGWVYPGLVYQGNVGWREFEGIPSDINTRRLLVAEYPAGTVFADVPYLGRMVEVKPLGNTRYATLTHTDNSSAEWFDFVTEDFVFSQQTDAPYRSAVKLTDGWYRLTTITRASSTGRLRNSLHWGEIAPLSSRHSLGATNPGGSNIAVRKPMVQKFAGPVTSPMVYQKITVGNADAIELEPNATLYQDTSGTTPASQPGETISLMLDKSKRLAKGPELIVHGDFASSLGWATGAQVTIANGTLRIVSTDGSFQSAARSIATTTGRLYEVVVEVLANVAGQIKVEFSGVSGSAANIPAIAGVHKVILGAVGVSGTITIGRVGGITDVTIGSISVREILGNHAVQSGASARPTLARHFKTARRNIIPNTSTILLAGVGAASTKTSYYSVTNDQWNVHTFVGANQRAVNGSVEMPVGATYTGSIYIDPAQTTNNTSFQIYFGIYGSQRARVTLNLADGVLTTSTAVGFAGYFDLNSYELIALPDGKYRFLMTMTNVFTTPLSVVYGPWSDASTINVATTSAQIEVGTSATTFQRIHSDFDMTEIGVPDVWFLSFDGVDDVMNTSAFTRTKAGFQTVGGFAVNAYNASTNVFAVFGLPATTERSFIGIRATGLGGASQISGGFRVASGTAYGATFGSAFVLGEPFVVAVTHDGANLTTTKNVSAMSATSTADVGTTEGALSAVIVGSPGLNMRFYGGFWRQLLPFGAHEIQIAEINTNEKVGIY